MKNKNLGKLMTITLLAAAFSLHVAAVEIEDENSTDIVLPQEENTALPILSTWTIGSWGTEFDICTKHIYTLNTDQTIEYKLNVDELDDGPWKKYWDELYDIEEYKIKLSDEEYEKLISEINAVDWDTIQVKEMQGVCDGYSTFFLTYDKDGKEKDTVGGYMITNEDLNQISRDFYSAVSEEDGEAIKSIVEKARDLYEKPSSQKEPAEETEEATEIQSPVLSMSDYLGAVNGISLTTGPNDISVFENAGFVFDEEDDGKYSFSKLHHSEDSDFIVYVYNEDWKNCSVADIRKNGFYGYEVDHTFAGTMPVSMTWKGLTFGATEEDVIAAYGKPSSRIELSENYISLEYEIADSPAESDISFKIINDYGKTGLQKVSLWIWGDADEFKEACLTEGMEETGLPEAESLNAELTLETEETVPVLTIWNASFGGGPEADIHQSVYTLYSDRTLGHKIIEGRFPVGTINLCKENLLSIYETSEDKIHLTEEEFSELMECIQNVNWEDVEIQSAQVEGGETTYYTVYDEAGKEMVATGGYAVKNEELRGIRRKIYELYEKTEDDQDDSD